jgi:hypothetical protein
MKSVYWLAIIVAVFAIICLFIVLSDLQEAASTGIFGGSSNNDAPPSLPSDNIFESDQPASSGDIPPSPQ